MASVSARTSSRTSAHHSARTSSRTFVHASSHACSMDGCDDQQRLSPHCDPDTLQTWQKIIKVKVIKVLRKPCEAGENSTEKVLWDFLLEAVAS